MLPANVSRTYSRFRKLVALGNQRFAVGDCGGAAAVARIAAHVAYPGEAGLFASPELEALLSDLSNACIREVFAPPRADKAVTEILHVLTHARPVGGDTRFVWRWIQQDSTRRHSVVITSQNDTSAEPEVPPLLAESVLASGGTLSVLRAGAYRPLQQAAELRRLCNGKDVVALHVFPYDVVPVLALAGCPEHIKVAYINHSDHTFWLGSSVANRVVHLRAQSNSFLEARRLLRPVSAPVLPIPLSSEIPSESRVLAKAKLAISAETLVLLTIASPFKYSSPRQNGLLELVLPLIRELPNVILLAVGPRDEGAWQQARESTGGRVRPLGTRWDTAELYAAADIYLDSVPFSSITSLLEAGSYGIPLLGLMPNTADLALLGASAPGLDNVIELGKDAHDYQARLGRLIADEKLRTSTGEVTAAEIAAVHTGSGWLDRLEMMYRDLAETKEKNCLARFADESISGEINQVLSALYGQGRDKRFYARLAAKTLGEVRFTKRVALAWRLILLGYPIDPSAVLSADFKSTLRVWSGIKRLEAVRYRR